MPNSPRRFLARLGGTRYRVYTSVLVAGYFIVIAAIVASIFMNKRAAQYRVVAETEYFTATLKRDLRIGQVHAAFDANGKTMACEAALVIPKAATLTGSVRSRDVKASQPHPTYIDVVAAPSTAIAVQCANGPPAEASSVVVSWRPPGGKDAEAPSDQDRLVLRLNGNVTLGHAVQDTTPADRARLLCSAQVTAEHREWPGGNLTALFERSVGAGNQLTFRGQDGRTADTEGLVVIRPTHFEVTLRFQGSEVLLTPPGAADGSAFAMAPTFLDRVKLQAEWAAWALVISLGLALLEVLRSFESSPKEARERRPTP